MTVTGIVARAGALSAALLAASCGGSEEAAPAGESARLMRGARGSAVAAATAYFTQYGYFEDADLRARFPNWRPLVGRAPADPTFFGDELALAVREYQARGGLEATGVIDAATRALMDTPRCGVPDSFRDSGEDKWSIGTSYTVQSNHALTYTISLDPICPQTNPQTGQCDNFNGLSPNEVKAAIQSAMATWQLRTDATFTESTNGKITIAFIDNTGGTSLATSTSTSSFYRNGVKWENIPNNGYDLQTVVTHELGHVLGFDHSSIQDSLMFATVGVREIKRQLRPDDEDAVAASPYTSWKPAAGVANEAIDIGSSISGGREFTWKVGNGSNSEGPNVWRWNEPTTAWIKIAGAGGTRIDVAGNTPWVVNNVGMIRSANISLPSCQNGCGWTDRGKCGSGFVDVGADPTGDVWALGGTIDGDGNYAVYRYVGGASGSATNCSLWRLVDGRARYIDVAPDASPWVITVGGAIYHRNGVTATSDGTGWSHYGGTALDVSLGTTTAGVSGTRWFTNPSNKVFSNNVQAKGTEGSPLAPAQNQWYALDGSGVSISVGASGLPWVVRADGSVWRRRPH